MDGYIKFALLTGVTKFGKVSVFSDLNNLMDLSRDLRYFDICGISEEELLRDFSDDIQELAAANGQTFEQACDPAQRGLRRLPLLSGFPGNVQSLQHPQHFQVQEDLRQLLVRDRHTDLPGRTSQKEQLRPGRDVHVETDANILDSIFTDDNPIPVIYQSGYLTIKGYDKRFGIYTLGFPNREVEEGFMNFLLSVLFQCQQDQLSVRDKRSSSQDVESGDIDGFMERLQSFLADCPYELAKGY